MTRHETSIMDQNFEKMDQNVFKMSEKMQLYKVFGDVRTRRTFSVALK